MIMRHSKIFPAQSTDSFNSSVREQLKQELSGLDPTAVLVMKSLIKRGLAEKNDLDAVNLRESYGTIPLTMKEWRLTYTKAQAERFASGIPAERFAKIANKEIKHKL